MKITGKVVLLSIVIYALDSAALAQGTWKLSSSLLETSNQISFSQGSSAVWYFLQSSSSKHDPKTYELLPSYSAPCGSSGAETLIDGVTCWLNSNADSGGNHAPLVGVNSTWHTQFPNLASGDPFGIPARSVWMHPGLTGQLVIIGWKSPITGLIDVSGFFSDLDPNCGDGIIWSVDKSIPQENQTLTSGTIANGGPLQSYSLSGLSIRAGQVLYFIVDRNQDYSCDSTGVDVTITAR